MTVRPFGAAVKVLAIAAAILVCLFLLIVIGIVLGGRGYRRRRRGL